LPGPSFFLFFPAVSYVGRVLLSFSHFSPSQREDGITYLVAKLLTRPLFFLFFDYDKVVPPFPSFPPSGPARSTFFPLPPAMSNLSVGVPLPLFFTGFGAWTCPVLFFTVGDYDSFFFPPSGRRHFFPSMDGFPLPQEAVARLSFHGWSHQRHGWYAVSLKNSNCSFFDGNTYLPLSAKPVPSPPRPNLLSIPKRRKRLRDGPDPYSPFFPRPLPLAVSPFTSPNEGLDRPLFQFFPLPKFIFPTSRREGGSPLPPSSGAMGH